MIQTFYFILSPFLFSLLDNYTTPSFQDTGQTSLKNVLDTKEEESAVILIIDYIVYTVNPGK